MKYHWINLFNMVEERGGFNSIEDAKADAVKVYTRIQGGTALHMGIGNDKGPICEGSIRKGKWIDGKPKLTKTQKEIGANYRAMRK